MKSKVCIVFSVILAAVFIYAGCVKVLDTTAFYKSIRMYQLLPDSLSWHLAHYLPWLEIIIGCGLLWKRLRDSAALLVSIALLVFIVAISSAWARGLDIDCGCFGKENISSNYTWLLIRDLLMLAASLYVFWSMSFTQSNRRTLENE